MIYRSYKCPSLEDILEYIKSQENSASGYLLSEEFEKKGFDPYTTQTFVHNLIERGVLQFDSQYRIQISN